MTDKVRLDQKAVVQSLTKKLIGSANADNAKRKQEHSALQKRVHKLEFTITKLYEDRVTGVLSEDTFKSLIQKSEAERQECEKRLALLESTEQITTAKLGDIEKWICLINENATFNDVDRDLIETLIERIEIGESRKVNGVKVRDVRIFYKFVGALPDNWGEVISL